MSQKHNIFGPIGLNQSDIKVSGQVFWNLGPAALYQEAISRGEATITDGGAIVVLTGEHTGRSANDKYIVQEVSSEQHIWWGKNNKPIAPENFLKIKDRLSKHLARSDVFVQDSYVGAEVRYKIGVRVVTETAWHSLFSQNMFRSRLSGGSEVFSPDWTILHSPSFFADPDSENTESGTFIIISFSARMILIGGTSYAGEIKKSVFSVLNYLLPAKTVLPMHCAVNVDANQEATVFFGLSGTGKTTLSADPQRLLVGDDEHGWSDSGLFNFEGGCYAKVIRLDQVAEPEIYATTRCFGTVLENVVVNEQDRSLDLNDSRYTENTRASYPIEFIPNIESKGYCGHPKNIVMLTADAYGVLPPIARLTTEEAIYHFVSGYTSKLAGTEKGLTKAPSATFSTCFGAPFMPRHPSIYADLLRDRLMVHDTTCWLVNTGWTGGPFGVGRRMPISVTRSLVQAALKGDLSRVEYAADARFGFSAPRSCEGVPAEILDPRNTWDDKQAFDQAANKLAANFKSNFQQFTTYFGEEICRAGPKTI